MTVYLAGTIYDSEGNLSGWEGFNKQAHSSFSGYTNNLGGNMAAKELMEKVFRDKKFDNGPDSARYVYNYIKKNFTISSGSFGGSPDGKIEKLIQKKNGSAMEVNLLLVKLFNDMGYKSNMVLLATRGRLRLSPEYPVLDNINYAVCRTEIGDARYYADAGAKYYPFGVLDPKCYNGFSWVVGEKGYKVNISPDEIRERSMMVIATESADVNNYIIKISETAGDVSSAGYREQWTKDSAEVKVHVLNQVKALPFKSELLEYSVENLDNTDKPLKITYRVKVEWPREEKLFITPSLYDYFTENPFKATVRASPVEMPCALDINYMLMLQLPDGYRVEEVPESKALKLDNNNSYKYLAEYRKETNMFMVSTRLQMANTYFEPGNYTALKSFFDKIMEQQNAKGLISKKTSDE